MALGQNGMHFVRGNHLLTIIGEHVREEEGRSPKIAEKVVQKLPNIRQSKSLLCQHVVPLVWNGAPAATGFRVCFDWSWQEGGLGMASAW